MATKRTSTRRKSASGQRRSSRKSSGRRNYKRSAAAQSGLYDEIILICVLLFCALLFLANIGIGGTIGEATKRILFGLFGSVSALFPLFAAGIAVFVYFNLGNPVLVPKLICAVVFFENICILFQIRQSDDYTNSQLNGYKFAIDRMKGGGFVAAKPCSVLKDKIGTAGMILLILVILLICIILFFEISVIDMIRDFSASFAQGYEEGQIRRQEEYERRVREQEKEDRRRRKERELQEKEEARLLRTEQKRKGITSNTKLKKPDVDIKELLVNHPDYVGPDEEDDEELYTDSRRDYESDHEDTASPSFFDETAQKAQDRINRKWDKIREQRRAEGEARRAEIAKNDANEPIEKDNFEHFEEESESEKREKLFAQTYDSTSPEEFDFRSVRPVKSEPSEDAIRDMMAQDDIISEESAAVISENNTDSSENLPEYAVTDYHFDEPEEFSPRSNVFDTSSGDFVSAEEDIEDDIFTPAEDNSEPEDQEEFSFEDTVDLEPSDIIKKATSSEPLKTVEPSKTAEPSKSAEPMKPSEPAKAVAVKPSDVVVKPLPKYVHKLPPLSLLNRGGKTAADATAELQETARLLEETLESFGVKAKVLDYTKGPTVTRFEIQPPTGVKVSKILGLVDDIKLKLAAADIRIEAPVPGKSVVGIEVPNKSNSMVMLGDLLSDGEFRENTKRGIAFAVGKDLGNKTIVADISKMPHVLIAGATGSGKSVCINTLIMSILFKYSPDEVKLIMVDPKVVELSVYNGIPHLLIPVVTDPKLASSALAWGVNEMMDRYQKFAEAGVRDLVGYNKKVMENRAKDPAFTAEPLYKLVIIVDELADLMMVSPGEVEESIVRLAQLARAAGIHLVLATQRPSVNVITGLIKANMPSRIAFSVTSGVDSRTILDMYGAEKLLGHGDMLYYPQGLTKPARLQGAFVSDEEVQSVVDFLKKQVEGTDFEQKQSTQIAQSVQSVESGSNASVSSGPERDEYFDQAAKFIIDKDRASIGALQRVFKIGFNRAARIMDQLCEAGIVGEEEGTKPRRVLMSEEQYEAWKEEYF